MKNILIMRMRYYVRRAKLLIEKLRDLDFDTVVQPEEVGLDPSLAFRSSPSGNRWLRNLLRDLTITNKDSIIDIGCGKGSALRVMLELPFSRVDGIELSPHICDIATKNFRILKAKNCEVIVCDAALWANFDAYNIIYFYNPFPCQIMSKVIRNLCGSINRMDRDVTIIYGNPVCHDVLVKEGGFLKIATYQDEWGNGIAVYSNRGNRSSRLSKVRFHDEGRSLCP